MFGFVVVFFFTKYSKYLPKKNYHPCKKKNKKHEKHPSPSQSFQFSPIRVSSSNFQHELPVSPPLTVVHQTNHIFHVLLLPPIDSSSWHEKKGIASTNKGNSPLSQHESCIVHMPSPWTLLISFDEERQEHPQVSFSMWLSSEGRHKRKESAAAVLQPHEYTETQSKAVLLLLLACCSCQSTCHSHLVSMGDCYQQATTE